MKKLNITKEQFNKSRYFKNKYGRLEYVSESGKMFKTNKGKVLMFKEWKDTGWEVGEQEWNVGDRVDINVWQVQWELDEDELASLPETGWTVKDAVRDDDYDDCDGFAYTIVHPGIEEEFVVSASALFKPSKPVRKPKGRALKSSRKSSRKFNEANFQLGDIDDTAVNEIVQRICKTLQKCKWVDHVEFDDIEDYFDVYTTDGRHFEFFGQEKPL